MNPMARIQKTREQIHREIYAAFPTWKPEERMAVEETINELSGRDDWYPNAFRRALKELEGEGKITKVRRHAVEKMFFPEEAW